MNRRMPRFWQAMARSAALILMIGLVQPARAQSPPGPGEAPPVPDLIRPSYGPNGMTAPPTDGDLLPMPTDRSPEAFGEAADRATGDLAFAAYQRGLYVTAFVAATERLEDDPDDAAAMTLIGELYRQGLGLPRDLSRAREWYELAASRGDPNAEFALGEMILQAMDSGDENSTEADPALIDEARGHFLRAAQAGHVEAAHALALLLLEIAGDNGGEAERAAAEAAEWLQPAAEAEIAAAQYTLAMLYRAGLGVAPNEARATALLHRSARNGHVPAMLEYAVAVFNGVGVAPDEARAAAWLRRAAWRGDALARNRLALLYATGRGVEEDRVEAAAWHLLAASQGLDDERLDGALAGLSQEERARAEALARDRAWP